MNIKAKVLLNYKDLIDSLQKVYNCQGFSVASAYRMKRMCDNITTEMKRVNELLRDIQKLDDEETKKAKLDELVDMDVEIKFGPITKEEFEALHGLSPMNINMLESFIEPSVLSELES